MLFHRGCLTGYVTGSNSPGAKILEKRVFTTEPIQNVGALCRCVKIAAGLLLANHVPAAGMPAVSASVFHGKTLHSKYPEWCKRLSNCDSQP